MKYTNPNPEDFNLKVYGKTSKVNTAEQMRERDLLQALATDEDYQRHNDEYAKRIRWCIDQGPEYWPAHDHKHCAPGDDTNFIFKIPPWHPDGTPNPLGIPDNCAWKPFCRSRIRINRNGQHRINRPTESASLVQPLPAGSAAILEAGANPRKNHARRHRRQLDTLGGS